MEEGGRKKWNEKKKEGEGRWKKGKKEKGKD